MYAHYDYEFRLSVSSGLHNFGLVQVHFDWPLPYDFKPNMFWFHFVFS